MMTVMVVMMMMTGGMLAVSSHELVGNTLELLHLDTRDRTGMRRGQVAQGGVLITEDEYRRSYRDLVPRPQHAPARDRRPVHGRSVPALQVLDGDKVATGRTRCILHSYRGTYVAHSNHSNNRTTVIQNNREQSRHVPGRSAGGESQSAPDGDAGGAAAGRASAAWWTIGMAEFLSGAFAKVLLVVSVAEFAVMYILHLLRVPDGPWEWLVDSCLLSVLSAPGIYLLVARPLREQNRILARNEELAVTLGSIGDGVIAVDMRGRVTRVNPVAEHLTGWGLGEAMGRPLGEIFKIVGARTNEPAADPVRRVLECGQVVGLANDTTLIARDGTRRQIADSAAPIRGEDGQVRGVVLVFHDVSAEYAVKEALRESEEKHRVLYVSSRDAIMTLEPPNWRFTGGNPATIRLFGARSEVEFVAKGPWNVSPERQPDGELSSEKARRMIETAMRDGSNFFEWTHCRLDGVPFPATVLLTRVEVGGRTLLQATARDITVQKCAEDTARRGLFEQTVLGSIMRTALDDASLDEQLGRALDLALSMPWLQALPQGAVFVVNHESNTLVMRAARGLPPELLTACASVPFGHCLCGRAAAECRILCAPSADARHERRFQGMAPHGHYCVPIVSEGKILGVLDLHVNEGHPADEREMAFLEAVADGLAGLIRRKRAEEALVRAHDQTRELLAAVSSVLIGVGPEGRITVWNQAAEAVFGIRTADAIGHLLAEFPFDPDAGAILAEAARLRPGEPPVRIHNVRFARAATGAGFLDVDVSLMWNEATERAEYLLSGTDVTERRHVEAQLVQAQKLESIGQLAAGIAHEINTPTQYVGDNTRFLQDSFVHLTTLCGHYDTLFEAARQGGPVPAAVVARVEEARRKADLEYLLDEIPRAIRQSLEGIERVVRIVGAMKDFSHMGTGEKMATDLNKAIETTITVARNEWRYVAEVVPELDPALPPVLCLPHEFNQVVLNLLVNAAHAIGDVVHGGADGKGVITVRTLRDGDWVEVRIGDTGAGIPDTVRHRIFDPFFTTKEVGKGTGQGLTIARSIVVDKHGGAISFETEIGKGTTFIVRLPLGGNPVAGGEGKA